MGTPFQGTREEFKYLIRRYEEYLVLFKKGKTRQFWAPFLREFFTLFPFTGRTFEGNFITKKKRTKQLRDWFRNHAVRGKKKQNIRYIQPARHRRRDILLEIEQEEDSEPGIHTCDSEEEPEPEEILEDISRDSNSENKVHQNSENGPIVEKGKLDLNENGSTSELSGLISAMDLTEVLDVDVRKSCRVDDADFGELPMNDSNDFGSELRSRDPSGKQDNPQEHESTSSDGSDRAPVSTYQPPYLSSIGEDEGGNNEDLLLSQDLERLSLRSIVSTTRASGSMVASLVRPPLCGMEDHTEESKSGSYKREQQQAKNTTASPTEIYSAPSTSKFRRTEAKLDQPSLAVDIAEIDEFIVQGGICSSYLKEALEFLTNVFEDRQFLGKVHWVMLVAIEHWKIFEWLMWNTEYIGELGGEELMPPELLNFKKSRHYKDIEIPANPSVYEVKFLIWWISLQPAWRSHTSASTITNADEGLRKTLYDNHNPTAHDESWQALMVGGPNGILLAVIGVAILCESIRVNKEERRNGVDENADRIIGDISFVIESMVKKLLEEKAQLR